MLEQPYNSVGDPADCLTTHDPQRSDNGSTLVSNRVPDSVVVAQSLRWQVQSLWVDTLQASPPSG